MKTHRCTKANGDPTRMRLGTLRLSQPTPISSHVMECGALEAIWDIEISDLISLKWAFITPRGEKQGHAPKPTYILWIYALSHWWDSFVCALWQVFVGWVKPYTAYPARAAFWMAAVFPGLTMKYHVFIGRDSIEKDVVNASPNLQRFQVTSWSAEP